MKAVYPVFFTKTDQIILVEVPDLEILTEGKDMNDAFEMARDAMELKCVVLEDEKKEILEENNKYAADRRYDLRLVFLWWRCHRR